MTLPLRDGYRLRPPARDLDRRLDRLRLRGHRGTFIPRHRALLSSPSHPAKVIPALLLSAAFWLALFLGRGGVARTWSAMMEFWRQVLGVDGYTLMVSYELFGVDFRLPYLHFGAAAPDYATWVAAAVVTVVVLLASLALPERFLPLAYFLRIAAFFQATAQVFFALWPESFPYQGDGYVHGMLIAGAFLVSLVPLVLAFTYYLFDYALWRKIGLTLLMMIHLLGMIPMQYVLHAWLLHHGSLLLMPLLFFVAGLPLNVMVFIAMFGWGYSWPDRLHGEDVQRKVRR